MKYLWAYTIPLVSFAGCYFGGFWTYSALIFAFGLIPILELLLPTDPANYDEENIQSRSKNPVFDFLLYLNIPIVFFILIFNLHQISAKTLFTAEWFGYVLSTGIVLGANGINVAHELGHRDSWLERMLAKLLLLPSHYMHFYIEHNHGHHLQVATPEDPSTAKFNQSIYSFWFQSVIGTYLKAWKIQWSLNKMENRHPLSWRNDMLWFAVFQGLYLLLVYTSFGLAGLLFVLLSGMVGFLLLETINYIEHYGLQRNRLASGRYERVSEKHSWNSNHILGRIMLYELTRHSDHHYKSQKKYQILEYHDNSPQLPFGYPTSMVLSLFPPLWFKVMNKRIPSQV